MEPQEIDYYCVDNCKENRKKHGCFDIIIAILVALFLAVIGLILGAAFSVALLDNIAVLILGAVFLVLAIILTIIYKMCICSRKKKC